MALPAHRKLYVTLLVACIGGYTWLFINETYFNSSSRDGYGGCIMKNMLHVPCPSCGTTRSVRSLLHGDISGALYWNPLGLLVLTTMTVAPVWVLLDMMKRKDSLYRFYLRAEQTLKKKQFAIFFGVLMAANWIWNIYKGS